ncbi:MAG: hypothetical protein KC964_24110, partial [Candidatus Omnitrophica bacterium]|nr:hypothetical protein [Candidatus Omnitrophota bacterium]
MTGCTEETKKGWGPLGAILLLDIIAVSSVLLNLLLSNLHHWFKPDEALIIGAIKQSDSFLEFHRSLQWNLFDNLLYYSLFRYLGLDIAGWKWIATGLTVANLGMFFWLHRKYSFLDGRSLLCTLLLIGVTFPFFRYGAWAVFIYAALMLFSTCLIGLVLTLNRDPSISWWKTLGISMGLTLYIAFDMRPLPAIGAVLVFHFFRSIGSKGFSPKNVVSTVGRDLLLGAPPLIVSLLLLHFSANPEFANPRRDLWPLYFSRSGFDQDLLGGIGFLFARSWSLLQSFFSTQVDPIEGLYALPGWATPALSIACCLGLIRSIFLRGSDRRAVAAYTLLALGLFFILSLLGKYPFGNVRYALALYAPILLFAAWGLMDLLSGSRFLLARFSNRKRDGVAFGLTISIAVILILAQIRVAMTFHSKAKNFNQGLEEVFEALDQVEFDGVLYDPNTQTVIRYRVPEFFQAPNYRLPREFSSRGQVDRFPLGAWRQLLSRYNRLLVFTDLPIDEHFGEHFQVAKELYRIEPLASAEHWNLALWTRYESLKPNEVNWCLHPNDFQRWVKVGDVQVDPGPALNSIEKDSGDRIELGPGANLYTFISTPSPPGIPIKGSVRLWSDTPVKVGLSLERHGDSPPEGSGVKWTT